MTEQRLNIVWGNAPETAEIEIVHGRLAHFGAADGNALVDDDCIRRQRQGPARWSLTLAEVRHHVGADATRVRLTAGDRSFAFFARDVMADHPIVLPAYGVVVTAGDDARSYECVLEAVRRPARPSGLERLAQEPEETFALASAAVRDSHSPTWLGLGRDMRMFEFDWREEYGYWGVIRPKLPKEGVRLPEAGNQPVEYGFVVGRGTNCTLNVTRRLEEGCLPIVHGHAYDGGIDYHLTAFVDQERTPLTATTLRGTHYLVADRYAFGYSHTDEQLKLAESLIDEEYLDLPEQTLFCLRIVAHNSSSVPSYAWFQAPNIEHVHTSQSLGKDAYVESPGMGRFSHDRVFCIARIDGQPFRQAEIAVLIPPQQHVVIEYYVPHQPIDASRAERLLVGQDQSFDQRHQRCRAFWLEKLDAAASIQLPEKRIEEMVRAGLLHLDLITYGHEPDGVLAPMVGRYAPIGTESAPIIQFYDTIGRHDLARRSLQYFLDKQRPSGQMQNYQYYQSETGPVLWSLGEHYRYTRDLAWVRGISSHLNRACDFLIAWRRRNMTDAHRGQGYGMLDGAVADPKEPAHYFMNAGYACLGLARVAEMFETLDPVRSRELAAEAQAMKQDILAALRQAVARGPVIPLEDGTWAPTCGPFAQAEGALALLADRTIAMTHGNFGAHDALVGSLYLILQEVLPPEDPLADLLLQVHHRLNTVRNVAPSQPYYCRQDYAHLRRGEVHAFLKGYYNTLAAQADRETYTFWEHQYRTGVHKTHEEAWFLMQTRWMLMLEVDQTLRLLPGIPRAWLSGEAPLSFAGLVSYFGPVTLEVHSQPQRGTITAKVQGAARPLPAHVALRLPHPHGLRATACEGGVYDPATETVHLNDYQGQASIRLSFDFS